MFYFEILLLISGFIYIALGLSLAVGIIRQTRIPLNSFEPNVSIVIPARNEEKNLPRCLESLSMLNYPSEKLEVIVVDDHSTDATKQIAEEYFQKYQYGNVVSMNEEAEDKNGKIAALSAGYRHSRGDIVIQTDADCIVYPGWVRAMVSCFSEETGIVGGITIVESSSQKKSWILEVQSLDWLYLLGAGIGANGIGIPLSCFGNNLAVRREAYKQAGGYESIPFTFTEDFALFKAITQKGWKARYSLNSGSVVRTTPPDSFGAFVNQRMRWASGGVKLAGKGIFLLTTAFFLHLFVILSLIMSDNPFLTWSVIFSAAGADWAVLYPLSKAIRKKELLEYFVHYEIYYYFYTVFSGLVFPFVPGLYWKGRKYR